MTFPEKEIVLDLTDAADSEDLLRDAKRIGIRTVISRKTFPKGREIDGLLTISVSNAGARDDSTAAWVEVNGVKDVDAAVEASAHKHAFVIVQCNNWKIIPLENLIAEFRRRKKRLYAYMREKSEIELAFTILEKGVDGIVIPAKSFETAKELIASLSGPPQFKTVQATVTKIQDAGLGDRACIDTASQLDVGEGMLVGSKSSFFFLVHGETVPSEYIPTRPFRVNAGAIHSYLLGPDGKTKYLSEIGSGDRVQVVSSKGGSRQVTVGRVKIERRPLIMIAAEVEGKEGSVMLQKAETIRLVRADGSPVAVTDLKEGERVLVHLGAGAGRHFGGEVDEFILER